MKVLLAIESGSNIQGMLQILEKLGLPKDSDLYLLHVIELKYLQTFPALEGSLGLGKELGNIREKLIAEGNQCFVAVKKHLSRLKVNCHPLLFREGVPGSEILNSIDRYSIDLAVLGTRGYSGIKRFLLGSTSDWVLREAPCSVLVIREKFRWAIPKNGKGINVLLAIDGSPDAIAALRFLKILDLGRSSTMRIVHVVEKEDYLVNRFKRTGQIDLAQFAEEIMRRCERAGMKLLKEAQRNIKRPGIKIKTVLSNGNAADEIINIASDFQANLVVLGSKGLTGIKRLLLGGVSRKVARYSPCSVLVVRGNTPSSN